MLRRKDGATWSIEMKKLLTAFVLAMLVASPAFAKKSHAISPEAAAAQAYAPSDSTPALASTVHKGAAPADQAYDRAYGSNAIVGPDGKLIGVASDPSIRSQLQRDGLPN
jgi:hypothetical protein